MTYMPPIGAIGVTPTSGSWLDRIVGAGIRWFTGTRNQFSRFQDARVNHAVVYVGDVPGELGPMLVQATPQGAVFSPWDAFGSDMIWIDPINTLLKAGKLDPLAPTDDQRMLVRATAIDLVLKKTGYNFIDFLAIAFAQKRLTFHFDAAKPPWWARRLASDKRMICSQLADYCWLKAGLHLFEDGRLPGLVSPADLMALQGP